MPAIATARDVLPDEPTDCAALAAHVHQPAVRLDHYLLQRLCDPDQTPSSAEPATAPADGPSALEELAAVVQRLRAEKRTVWIGPGTASKLQLAPPRGGQRDVYVLDREDDERVRQELDVEPYLGSGGALGLLHMTWGIDGHFDVTGKAVERLKRVAAPGFENFSYQAIGVLQDASQDPDLYEWDTPAAHAQSGNANDGRALAREWVSEWSTWTRGKLDSARRAAAEGRPDHALFWIGYALHSIEDLASHRGRSNAEHSCNEHVGQSPDVDSAAVEHAQALAAQVLEGLPHELGPHWNALATYDGPRALTKPAKARLLGHGWDLDVTAIWTYKKLGRTFASLADRHDHQLRWCAPSQCTQLVAQLLSRTTNAQPYKCKPLPEAVCGCDE